MRINSAAAFVGMVVFNCVGASTVLSQQAPIGYDDTPMQPNGLWKVHDIKPLARESSRPGRSCRSRRQLTRSSSSATPTMSRSGR